MTDEAGRRERVEPGQPGGQRELALPGEPEALRESELPGQPGEPVRPGGQRELAAPVRLGHPGGQRELAARELREPREPRNVPSLLARLRREGFTGAVEVTGGPGGAIFLRDGLVGAVETPAAPSVRSLLLRSRRIEEPRWEAALAAVAEDGGLAAELTAQGLITAAELAVVCTAAVFDGAFAMALHPVTGWRVDPGRAPELAAWPGQEPARLTDETALRLRTLRKRFASVGEFARTPVRPAPRPAVDGLGDRGRTLLLSADGRRTPRDLAFALGRGVYPVMLDLARLSARDVLARDADALAPRPLLTARAAEPPLPGAPPAADRPLPRRRPGTNLPAGRPANGPRPTAPPQAVLPQAVQPQAVQPDAARAPEEAPEAPRAPRAPEATAGEPTVGEPPVAVRGTEAGRPEESAP